MESLLDDHQGTKRSIKMNINDDRVRIFKDDLETILCKYSINFPFWGVLSERCSYSLTETAVPTAGVDKFGNIIFNINFWSDLREKFGEVYHKKFLFLLSHEISHFAFEHSSRRESRDHSLFNISCDYAINLLLMYQFEKDKDYFIEGGCLDENYKDMTAEAIYELLLQKDKVKTDIILDIKFDDSDSDSDCDSGEGDTIVIRDRRVPLPSTVGKSKSQVDNELKDHVVKAFNEAFAVAKSQGKLPADFERAINKILKPKVDWFRALRNKIRYGISRMEKRDVTWSIPNRRFLGSSFIFPSNIGPESPKIAYAVDTSGSMSRNDLEQAMGELEDIRKKFNAKVYVLDCDADVHSSDWIAPNQPLPVLNGGGGTDFRPVFEHILQKRIKPDYIVFFTDGYGEFGDDPNLPVLWVMTSDVKPPFGDCVQINVPCEE